MAVTCPACGGENRDGARFCDRCGAPLAAAPSLAVQNRKVVTVLFTDVTGSTGLGERLDPESLRGIMSRFFTVARTAIERHGGTVEKYIGDAVMAVFGIPTAHEDDALRAVRASLDVAAALDAVNDELERSQGVRLTLRTGINTGEVVVGGSSAETLVTGDAVNVAARLQQAAEPGETLLGPATQRLVRHSIETVAVGPLTLRGKSEALPAFRLEGERSVREADAAVDRPIVGRGRELAQLRDVFAAVRADGRTHLFTLLGSAGVGKSRLVREFLSAAPVAGSGATILRGRCLPYGDGLTYWPIAEALRSLAGIGEDDSADLARERLHDRLAGIPAAAEQRVAEVVGLAEGTATADEIRWAVRSVLERTAADAPVILVIDDLQWSEPPLLDLVEHVADLSRDAAILLLCVARPELLDARPGWAGGKVNATTLLLEPLPAADAGTLVDHLLGGGLPAEVRDRILAAAEGNPLFAEEFAAMLADEGLVVRAGDGWRAAADLSRVVVPPSIQAVLAARLDRLPPEERAVAGRAAVVGRVFEGGAVVALSPEPERSDVPGRIASLVRKELVRPDRPGIGGLDAFRFRHLLIRDAAYDALSKLDRAALHEQFADWLVASAEDRLVEYEEIVAYHLREAFRFREQLGERDGHTAELGRRAAAHYAAAARRAVSREDTAAARTLVETAIELTESGSPERYDLEVELSDALIMAGSFDAALALLDRIPAAARRDPGLDARIRLQQARARFNTDPTTSFEAIAGQLAELGELFERLGDRRSFVKALRWRWFALFAQGRASEAATFIDAAIDGAGYEVESAEWLELARWQPLADAFGPEPVDRAMARAEALRARVAGHPSVEAIVLLGLGLMRVMSGEVDAGLAEIHDGADRLGALGQDVWRGGGLQLAGYALLIADRVDEAEVALREADAILEGLAETGFRSTVLGLLAVALARLGREEDAIAATDVAERIAAADDIITHVLVGIARAAAAALSGDTGLAIERAQAAVGLATTRDYAPITGDAHLALATILTAAGRRAEADAAARQAAVIYAEKGNRLGERSATTLIEQLAVISLGAERAAP